MTPNSSSEIRAAITALENQRNEIASQLFRSFQRYCETLVPEVTAWINEAVETTLVQKAEVVAKLSDKELSDLKKDIETLKASLPSLAEKFKVDTSLIPRAPYNSTWNHDQVFRLQVERLGGILGRRGFVSMTPTGESLWRADPDKVRLNQNVLLPTEKNADFQDYQRLSQKYNDLGDKLAPLNEQLQKIDALERFRKA